MENKTWDIPLDFYGKHFDLTGNADRYVDSERVGLTLTHTENGFEETFTTLTENVPYVELEDEQRQVIVNPDVTSDTLNAVFDSGLLRREPDFVVPLGMGTAAVHSFTDKAQAWITNKLQNVEVSQSTIDAVEFAKAAFPTGVNHATNSVTADDVIPSQHEKTNIASNDSGSVAEC